MTTGRINQVTTVPKRPKASLTPKLLAPSRGSSLGSEFVIDKGNTFAVNRPERNRGHPSTPPPCRGGRTSEFPRGQPSPPPSSPISQNSSALLPVCVRQRSWA